MSSDIATWPLGLLPPEPVGSSTSAQRRAGSQGRSEAESAAALDGLRRCARVRRRSVQVGAGGLLPLVSEAPRRVWVSTMRAVARIGAVRRVPGHCLRWMGFAESPV